jgi:hypothetical protein
MMNDQERIKLIDSIASGEYDPDTSLYSQKEMHLIIKAAYDRGIGDAMGCYVRNSPFVHSDAVEEVFKLLNRPT